MMAGPAFAARSRNRELRAGEPSRDGNAIMSIETLLPLAEPPALPAAPTPAPTLADPTATPSPPDSAPSSLQERRLRAARELDSRIHRLEQETVKLATELDASRRNAREHLAELQQRSTSLTTEVLRVGARLARQGRDQDEQRRLLDHRLSQRVRELEVALLPLGETLRNQADQLQELQSRHDTLSRLHEHLDRIVSRQGRGLDIVAAEFDQRVELLRVSLEGVQALFREQQESQMRMAVEQASLGVVAQALQARLDDARDDQSRQHAETRQRLRVLTSLLATLAIAGLGLIVWCQFHPLTVPTSTRQELATLSTSLGQQQDHGAQLAHALSQQATELRSLHQELAQVQRDNLRLQVESRRQRASLSRMTARLAAATAATPTAARLEAPEPTQASSPAPDKGTTAWPTHEGSPLPLPPSVPGLRAGI